MSRVPERNSHRRAPLRPLHPTRDGPRRLNKLHAVETLLATSLPAPSVLPLKDSGNIVLCSCAGFSSTPPFWCPFFSLESQRHRTRAPRQLLPNTHRRRPLHPPSTPAP